MKQRVLNLTSRITLSCLGKEFRIKVELDQIWSLPDLQVGRVYIQLEYNSVCTKTGKDDNWRGRKWYLSESMTNDEIVKTCYTAFEAAVKHEIMEGFKVDGVILFNPHVNFEELLKVSDKEVTRKKISEKHL